MLHQIAYAALSTATAVLVAFPAHAHRHCPTDYGNPLCVPAGATEQDEQSSGTIRGSGR